MPKLNTIQESVPFIITALWFGFVSVNVNQLLGLIYLAVFTLGGMIIYKWDKTRSTPLDRTGKWIVPIGQGVLIYVLFVMLASVLAPLFQQIDVGKLIQLIAISSPVLAESEILNTITFVLFVPFAETIFFVVLMDYLATKWNIDITRRGLFRLGTLALITGLSFLFLLYHVTAKGISNNAALMLVFLMMFITLGVSIWFGESKQAVIFHIIANAFGIGLFSIWPKGAVFIIPAFLLLNKPKNKNG